MSEQSNRHHDDMLDIEREQKKEKESLDRHREERERASERERHVLSFVASSSCLL